MMKKATLFAAILMSSSAFTQKVSISEIHISSGSGTSNASIGSMDDFKVLASNSSILAMDLSLLKPQNNMYFNPFGTNSSSSYSLQLGLQCAKMPKSTIRLGITHMSNYGVLSANGSYTETAPYDTLTSSQTGQQIFIDSSFNRSYNMDYSTQQLRLDGAMIFRMFPEKRWSLHTGFGASLGMSYRSTTNIQYWESSSVSSANGYSYTGEGTSESFKNKNSFAASLYVPFGVDLGGRRISAFWMPFHLYTEIRPSLNLHSIQELGTSFSTGMSSALGLRIKL